ncbi:MAG: sensor histidine kinase [Rikenellaceae bacterium]
MVNEKKIYAVEFTAIILLWTLVIISPLLFMEDYSVDSRAIHVMWVECAVVGFAFLVNRFFFMPKLFFNKRYILYTISIVVLFICLSLFIISFDGVNAILTLFGEGNVGGYPPPHIMGGGAPPHERLSTLPHFGAQHITKPPVTTFISPMITVLIASLIAISLDLGIRIAVTWVITEQKHSLRDKERVVSQLQNLQSQVSPHFFMNTLNNIHALIEVDPQRARHTIIELSNLMSYLLYDSSRKSVVSLQREMEFINNYINLMRLRFSEHVKIDLSYNNPPDVDIPPHLFLNFIENAFKHGVDYDHESFIKVRFNFTSSTIEMVTINTNHKRSSNRQHGLGISNSRKRLDLLYGANYTLNISEKENIFYVNLIIPTT